MPYRAKLEAPQGTGDLVTVRRYLDVVQAEIDRARLTADGIEAHILEAASYNPLLAGAAGGIRLQVREGDLRRAEALLTDHPEAEPADDGEEAGTVRCPRCELSYCFHERVRTEGSSAMTALSFFAAIFVAAMPKRWHCHKCGHVWDDPKEGPAEMTRLDPGDLRPVFRLRRSHAAMGLFLGLMAWVVLSFVLIGMGRDYVWMSVFVFLTPVIGWAVGRSLRYDVCSYPSCRAPLDPDREDCPRCKGAIAGVIRSAEEHYSAAGDFRRELAEERRKDLARPKKLPKKARQRRRTTT